MGGRGGSGPRAGTPAAAAPVALTLDPRREYQQWLNNPRDISADSETGMNDSSEKILLQLPDRDATLKWEEAAQTFVVRDSSTDERLPFEGQRRTTVFHRISRFYGKKIEYVDGQGGTTTFGQNAADLRKTPAARKYGAK